MLKRCKNFIFALLVGIFFFFSIDNVIADEKIRQVRVRGDNLYYYTSQNSKYGSYAGTSSSSGAKNYTKYKYIGYEDNPVYCVQSANYAPKDGASYAEVNIGSSIENKTWTTKDAYVSGCIMQVISEKVGINDEPNAYVANYATLNSYLNFNKSIDFSAYNPTVKSYVDEAKECYDSVKLSDSLPSFTVKAVNNVLTIHNSGSLTYYVGAFKLSDIVDSYGGDQILYKISLPSGVSLCSNSSCTSINNKLIYIKSEIDKVGTVYFKVTGVNAGQDISIKVTASNSSEYGYGRLWRPVDSNSQLLLSYGVNTINRTTSKNVTFTVPDVTNKVIKLVKKDSTNGQFLLGANLTLKLSGGSNNSCTISGDNYSCSISIAENLVADTYYSVVENSSPNGYVKGSNILDTKWNLNESTNICYVSVGGVLKETDIADCNRNYLFGEVCLVDGVYNVGRCAVEYDYTGLVYDEVEGVYRDAITSEIVEVPIVVIGTNANICYYDTGSGISEVDKSKCDGQYTKVTNTSGNLVVEYYNNKNRVEISKVSISGDKELAGADLKICSTKPDENGNCTIVRNTLDGQCKAVNVDENGDEVGIVTEFNCVNNDNDTKTVDMRWISGNTSKVWNGISKGVYYLVETVAPGGFLPLTTYIEFSIDDYGNVTSEAYNKEIGKIVVNNRPTDFKVIKQDVDSGKNLEGAKLSICTAYKDTNGIYQLDVGDDGYCVPAVLSNGETASWTTTNKAKTVSGLGIGTYYLVEVTAPDGYAVTDSILFTLNANGTITDKDGNLIKNNELIIFDKRIDNPKTSGISTLMFVVGGIVLIGACAGSYYYLVEKNGIDVIKNKLKKSEK